MVKYNTSQYTWETISFIQKSKFIKPIAIWFILLPLIAKAIESETIKSYIPPDLELPFSWGVFYIASTAFFIASVIYSIKCPDIIKNYLGLSDYISKNGSASYLATLLLKIVKEKTEKERSNLILKFISDDHVNFTKPNKSWNHMKNNFKRINHLDDTYDVNQEFIENDEIDRIGYQNLSESIKSDYESFIMTQLQVNNLPNGENLPSLFSYLREIAATNSLWTRRAIQTLHFVGFTALAYVVFENIISVLEHYELISW